MNAQDFQRIQEEIGYRFSQPRLLLQAFIRKSYAREHPEYEDNEVLELIGDSMLDLVVLRFLMEQDAEITSNGLESHHKEGYYSSLKSRFVNRTLLAERMTLLGYNQFLFLGNGETNNQEEDKVKEDLFEAIIGAVTLDSNYDTDTVYNVMRVMLDPEYYLSNGFNEKQTNFVGLVQEWAQKKGYEVPNYSYNSYWNREIICTSTYLNKYWRAEGKSQIEARMAVAHLIYDYLDEQGALVSMKDEIGEPSLDRAINQLQELAQKGYISTPEYNEEEEEDDNGLPAWKVQVYVEEAGFFFYAIERSKKEAKKKAALGMLEEILKMEK